jgi:type I restriction enzyme, R subunit
MENFWSNCYPNWSKVEEELNSFKNNSHMKAKAYLEDNISKLPALDFLQAMGYQYLSPEEALKLRGGKESEVILEEVLVGQLRERSFSYKGEKHLFSENNIQTAIAELKNLPLQEGFMQASEYAYDLLTMGTALEQTVEGDKKSYTLPFVLWDMEWEENVFHVTEEYNVERSGKTTSYTPDLVLFVNGIPFAVIEAKRPDIEAPIEQAISQHLRNQQSDGIRPLYAYVQIVMSIAMNDGRYATAGTPKKFWSRWRERFADSKAQARWETQLREFKQQAASGAEVTVQDRYLFGLCYPERLLELSRWFMVYDEGVKKIARYQQYFAIRKVMQRIGTIQGGRRKGGVIYHTQGSGKSLTMVLLAQAISMHEDIQNPKIVLVTDRIDLDDQIFNTFKKCNKEVEQAKTGNHLIELLDDPGDDIITTIVNKFEAAVKKMEEPVTSPNTFVLVDEAHRSQYGSFNARMRQVFENGCFIAFTGTPLMKKEKSTADKFGGLIDSYTVDEAVADEAVVPLLYEGRHANQEVRSKPLDNYFELICRKLNDKQKADLKKKFNRAEQLNIADQKIYANATDISLHFEENWKGTPYKAQLVCQNKDAAVRYKQYLDEIGIVSSELLFSAPDTREGEDEAYGETSDRVKQFWNKMMDKYGNAKNYEKTIINSFKKGEEPEIIIVVDKLLTGFDAPKNTTLYITRSLRDHTLLQAIARVNRVFPGKDFGYIIDYYGVLGELDEALNRYSGLEGFDEDDLKGTVTNVRQEVSKLKQRYSDLKGIFKTIKNKEDVESYERLLADEAIREDFYEKLSLFARTLKLAMSTMDFYAEYSEKEIEKYKQESKFFLKLRVSVKQRYSDEIDYKDYEEQIQKLIDKHIESNEVIQLTEQVNIFEKEKFKAEVEKRIGAAAKADLIASRTKKTIRIRMEEDEAFYKKFSKLLQETIEEFRQGRISEVEYLKRTENIMDSVVNHTDSSIPEQLKERDVAKAFYGSVKEFLELKAAESALLEEMSVKAGIQVDEIIRGHVLDNEEPKVDWVNDSDVVGTLQIDIGDYLLDEVAEKLEITIDLEEADDLAEKCIKIAKKRYK